MSLRYRRRFPYDNEYRVYLGIIPTLSTEKPGLLRCTIHTGVRRVYTQSLTVVHPRVYVRADKKMDNGCTLCVAYPCSDAYPSMPRVSTKHAMLSYTLSTIENVLQAFENSTVNSKCS